MSDFDARSLTHNWPDILWPAFRNFSEYEWIVSNPDNQAQQKRLSAWTNVIPIVEYHGCSYVPIEYAKNLFT